VSRILDFSTSVKDVDGLGKVVVDFDIKEFNE
jgi:hypothetical protein